MVSRPFHAKWYYGMAIFSAKALHRYCRFITDEQCDMFLEEAHEDRLAVEFVIFDALRGE